MVGVMRLARSECYLCYVIGFWCVWVRKGVRWEAGGEAAMIYWLSVCLGAVIISGS
jgi:hypothetical protein